MNIKEYREKLGITQGELSLKLGVTQSALSQYENGKRKTPFHVVVSIAQIFNCTIDELVKGGDDSNE